jgi:predicted TIM-barrel fold metal-dependent hydrolase
MYQEAAASDRLKTSVTEIEGFDIGIALKRLDEIGVIKFQTMPQEMTRVWKQWLGSNELSADIQSAAPDRIVAFASAEPLDSHDALSLATLEGVKTIITKEGLKGLLLTPPYGRYYSNDKRVYPFYEMAVELDIPVYFHHSHMFGDPSICPLRYARIWLLDDLTIDFPNLRFNVEHMGYPWTEELLAIMSRSPNVYTDIAMYLNLNPIWRRIPVPSRGLLLARNLGMAREYGVLERVFYGSDYVGESVDEYVSLLNNEVAWIATKLNTDMEKLGYAPLSDEEMEGLLRKNVLKLWK